MQVKVDRRCKNNFLVTNSYTLGKGVSYGDGDSNGNISTPADIERSWGRTVNDRTHTSSSAASSTACRSSKDGVARLDRQRLAVLGALHRAVGHGARHPGERRDAPRAGQHAACGQERRLRDPRRHRRRRRSGSTRRCSPTPAANTFGNLTRNGAGINDPGYVNLDASIVKRFGIGLEVRRVPRRRVQRDQLAARQQPERHVRQCDLRTDHRRPTASASSGSA